MRTSVALVLAVLVLLAGCGQEGLRLEGPESQGDSTTRAGQGEGSRGQGRSSAPRGCAASPRAVRRLGRLALLQGSEVVLLDLASCRTRRLVGEGARPPVRFSADGRWLAYGSAVVVSPRGGDALHPLGTDIPRGPRGWAWSPKGSEMAGVTEAGGVVIGRPRERRRRLLPGGWDARGVRFSPDGRSLAVSREQRAERDAELWIVDRTTGDTRKLETFPATRTIELAGWSGDSERVLVWVNKFGSASLASDGLPLQALSVLGERTIELAPSSLPFEDTVSVCGAGVVFTAGGGRDATKAKSLWRAGPPTWRPAQVLDGPRSFAAPTCSPDGEAVAVAAGPDGRQRSLGQEGRGLRQVSLVRDERRQLTEPSGAGVSDESPRWSRAGAWLLFVRVAASRDGDGRLGAPAFVSASGATGGDVTPMLEMAGPSDSYYGHYDWAERITWDLGASVSP